MDEKLIKELALHREQRAFVKMGSGKKMSLLATRKGKPHKPYTDKQKLIALQVYSATGSYVVAAQESGMHYDTLRNIGMTQWWKDSLKEIQREEDNALDAEMSGLIKEGMGAIKDRLKNGDWMWNSKENKFTRKPLKATDALKVTTSLMDQRNVARGKPTRITEQVSVHDRLAKLALEFESFQTSRTIKQPPSVDITDVEIIDGNS
jgi:hypothetical protein